MEGGGAARGAGDGGEERTLGEEHPSTLTSMANLADTLRGIDRTDDATELMKRSALLSSSTLGHGHPDTLHRYQQVDEWTGKSDRETADNTRVVDSDASDYSDHDRDVDKHGSRCKEAKDDASDNDEDDGNDSGRIVMSDGGGSDNGDSAR